VSSTYIPAELRRVVVERAESTREYCLLAEADTFFGCEMDHIAGSRVAPRHDGASWRPAMETLVPCKHYACGGDEPGHVR
jgi:hypothetical protein